MTSLIDIISILSALAPPPMRTRYRQEYQRVQKSLGAFQLLRRFGTQALSLKEVRFDFGAHKSYFSFVDCERGLPVV